MVLFTPTTTLILEGVKFSDALSPTPRGRRTWTVPGWVDVELVLVVVVDVLEVLVVVVVEERVFVEEVDVVVEVLEVVEVVGVVAVDLRVVVDDVDEASVAEEEVLVDVTVCEALLVDEEVEYPVELLSPVVVDEGCDRTSAASAPPRMTSDTPAMIAAAPSFAAMPADFLACNSRGPLPLRPLSACV
jgi:hypothetical protein